VAKPKDLYMNTCRIKLKTAASSVTLVEAKKDTGLSVRGGLIWLLHAVEFFFVAAHSTTVRSKLLLSTVPDLATFPALGDRGVISVGEVLTMLSSSGGGWLKQPIVNKYLPPIPLASPNISLYWMSSVDVAEIRLVDMEARLLFTTAPLDQKTYVEIAEVWGW